MYIPKRALWILLLLVFTTGCAQQKNSSSSQSENISSESESRSEEELRIEAEVAAIKVIQQNCASCHNEQNPSGGYGPFTNLDLLISQGLVVPGEPANSLLWTVIRSGQMPTTGPLSDEDQEAIGLWISSVLPVKPGINVSFDETWSIIQSKCLSCHSTAAGALGGINFDNGFEAVAAFSTAGDPYSSRLFDSVLQARMPPAPDSMTTQELAIIFNWIEYGQSPELSTEAN